MDGLRITKVFFPEPGRSPLPEQENLEEYEQRNRMTTMETGKSFDEWQRDLQGQNVLEQPTGPAGWTAWSIVMANGEVMVVMFRTKGSSQRRLLSVLSDLNKFFSDKIPFTMDQVYFQMQRFIGAHLRQMQT